MNSTDKMEMQLTEADDGSAIVQLPAGDDDIIQEPEKLATGGSIQEQTEGDDSDDGDDGLDGDPDREAIRAARREERKLKKQIHREKAKESNHLINALKKQNQQLAERLANLETRTSGAELARVEKVMDDTAVQIEYAKMKMKEAVSSQDGEALVRAQELMYESMRKYESLKSVKENATKQMSQPPRQNIQLPDPVVQRNAADWMSRNQWYDPAGKDLDSELTQGIDKRLTAEGYDPSSPDYWEELDDRLAKYLPHRYSQSRNEVAPPQRRRSPVTGTGRETAPARGGSTFTLSPERVAAIKEMGAWDDPEKRKKMVQRFAEYDRQNKGR
jgi:hypothetical protein